MSMKAIFREVNNVQNPALGAALIWRFAIGYSSTSRTSDYPVLQLCFLVPPMIFHRETYDLLVGTMAKSGLHQFVDKFGQSENLKSDVLLDLHARASTMRSLTLTSIKLGVRAGLFTVDSHTARVMPRSETTPRGVAASVQKMLNNSEKLGGWFSNLSLFEVSSALKVGF